MATSGVFSPYQSLGASAMTTNSSSSTSSSSSSSSSTSDTATISANDFLTLLVTEMQNQDPTSDTDPNEYINQLVNVNSLEQLISINQTLTDAYGSTSSTSSTTSSSSGSGSTTTGKVSHSGTDTTAQVQNANSAKASAMQQAQNMLAANTTSPTTQSYGGNLGVSNLSNSAQAVAHALDGHNSSTSSGLLNQLR